MASISLVYKQDASIPTNIHKTHPFHLTHTPHMHLTSHTYFTHIHLTHTTHTTTYKEVFHLPPDEVFAWSDSTIVLNWLVGNPRRLKTYVGNRVSCIVELIAPEHWNHVEGTQNPADCASRGLFPSELLDHSLWWNGPGWLRLDATEWPRQPQLTPNSPSEEDGEICLLTTVSQMDPVIPVDHFSSFTRLKRVTAWVTRFVHNCQTSKRGRTGSSGVEIG